MCTLWLGSSYPINYSIPCHIPLTVYIHFDDTPKAALTGGIPCGHTELFMTDLIHSSGIEYCAWSLQSWDFLIYFLIQSEMAHAASVSRRDGCPRNTEENPLV